MADVSTVEATTRTKSRRGLFASFGALGAAFLASLCCIGPLLFVTLGVGAGLASTFAPLRPVFTIMTVALLAVGFYMVYRQKGTEVCAPDGTCAAPRAAKREKLMLWSATVLAAALLTFPEWSLVLL